MCFLIKFGTIMFFRLLLFCCVGFSVLSPLSYGEGDWCTLGRPTRCGFDGQPGRCVMNPDGSFGGFVAYSATVGPNVHTSMSAQICDSARVTGKAKIYGNALITGNAQVSGDNIQIGGNAHVSGNAKISGKAWVYGDASVYQFAEIYGNARVFGGADVSGYAKIYGSAELSGNVEVSWEARVSGNAQISSGYIRDNEFDYDGAEPDQTQLASTAPPLAESNECVICMSAEKNTAIIPCGHLATCSECVLNLRECPICRTVKTGTLKVFK